MQMEISAMNEITQNVALMSIYSKKTQKVFENHTAIRAPTDGWRCTSIFDVDTE